MAKKLITPSILQRRAEALIAAGKMPSLDEILKVIEQVREKYAHKILEARKANQRRVQWMQL